MMAPTDSSKRRAAVVVVMACAAIAVVAAGAAGAGAKAPARLSLQQFHAAWAAASEYAQPQAAYAAQPPPQQQLQSPAATNLSPEQLAAASRAVYAQMQSAYVAQHPQMVAQQLQEAPLAPQPPPLAQVAPQAPSAPLLVAPTWAWAPVPAAAAPASALQEAPAVPPAAPPAVPPTAPPDQPAAKDWSKIGGGDVSARAGGNGFGSAGPTSAAEGGDENIEDYQKVKKERRFAMDFCDAKFNSWANIQKCIHLLFSACYRTLLFLSVLALERDTCALLFSCSICFFCTRLSADATTSWQNRECALLDARPQVMSCDLRVRQSSLEIVTGMRLLSAVDQHTPGKQPKWVAFLEC